MSRRRYSKTEYFEFLYDMAFTSDKYYELAKVLHGMDYIWYNLMDENTMYNGIEIRKYYLCDELGYMPEEIDEYVRSVSAEERAWVRRSLRLQQR